MSSEAGLWGRVREALNHPPFSFARKLTDAFVAGTPDAYYVVNGRVGFLELKHVDDWPKRASTLVSLGHGVTPEQRRYLGMLWAAGVPAYVLFGVGSGKRLELFMLRPDQVPEDGLKIDREVLTSSAVVRTYLPDLRAALDWLPPPPAPAFGSPSAGAAIPEI